MVRVGAQERIEKYDYKREEGMIIDYERAVKKRKPRLERLGARAELDAKIGAILTNHGIGGTDRIDYLNFARYIEKRHREGTLVPDVLEAEKAKYERKDCDPAILDEIVRAITGASA